MIIHTLGDKAKNATRTVVHVEGDPDSPINRGTLCPKGATLKYDIDNPNRIRTPKVRRRRPRVPHAAWDDSILRVPQRGRRRRWARLHHPKWYREVTNQQAKTGN